MTIYAIHWFWDASRYSDAPDPPDTCPQCGAPVAWLEHQQETICRHYQAGDTKTDGTTATTNCPYIITINAAQYAQPLAGDPVLP